MLYFSFVGKVFFTGNVYQHLQTSVKSSTDKNLACRPAMLLLVNIMNKSAINLTGEAIALEANDALEGEAAQVRNELGSTLVPQSMAAIWAFSPDLAKLRSKYGSQISEKLSLALTHNVITFPGSTGLERVKSDLISSGIEPSLALGAIRTLGNLTRFPLSILNLSRHLRTANNFILKVLTLSQDALSKEIYADVSKKSNLLAGRVIKDEIELAAWLNDLEQIVDQYIILERNRKTSHKKIENKIATRENASAHQAAAYTRRFARYVGISLGLKSIPDYFESQTDLSLLMELARLKKIYKGGAEELYNILVEEYQAKSARIKSPGRLSNSSNSQSVSHLRHELSLGARKLVIILSPEPKTSQFMEEFEKLINMQFDLQLFGDILNAKLARDGQSIEVRLENPNREDKRKLKQIIDALI